MAPEHVRDSFAVMPGVASVPSAGVARGADGRRSEKYSERSRATERLHEAGASSPGLSAHVAVHVDLHGKS